MTVLSVIPKRQNENNAPYEKNYNNLTKNVYYVFSNFLGTKTPKCMQSILYGKINKTLPKTCVFSVFSFLGTKTYAKHPSWRNRTTLPKTYVSSVSQLVRIKTLKCLQSTLIWTTRRYYKKTCFLPY